MADHEVNCLGETRVKQGLAACERYLFYAKGFGFLADAIKKVKREVMLGTGEITHAVEALEIACIRKLNPYGV